MSPPADATGASAWDLCATRSHMVAAPSAAAPSTLQGAVGETQNHEAPDIGLTPILVTSENPLQATASALSTWSDLEFAPEVTLALA